MKALLIQRRAAALTLLAGLCASAPAPADTSVPSLSPTMMHYSEQGGPQLYGAICAACHMPDGQGAQGAGRFPALAANPALASADYVLGNVLHGRRGMPAFGRSLDDAQVAAVVNYVRGNFGNHFPATVTPEQVRAAR